MASLKGKRVAVAGITFESNSFAPGLTNLDAFERYLFAEGPTVLTAGFGKDEIGGAISVADELGIELVPVFASDGGCGPTVSDKTYEFLKERLFSKLSEVLGSVDGVYLRLHGAMTAESYEDVEGDLIESLRKIVGPDFPIAVSCDFHGHFTEKMAKSTALIAGYQTCPHLDFFETGARAMRLMAAELSGTKKPTLSYRKTKLLASAEGHDTSFGPLRAVMDRLHEIEKLPGVLDATIFCTQPWLDVTELGWSTLVVTEDNPELGQKLADELALMLWDRREAVLFRKEKVENIVAEINASEPSAKPFIIADGADSTSAGCLGDSNYLLKYLLQNPIKGTVYMTVTDPALAKKCFAAGVGGEVTSDIGGSLSPVFFSPVEVTGEVVTLCDGVYQSKYPSKMFNSGPTAVFRVGEISIVVTSKPAFMLDYQLYLRVGLDFTSAKAVQVKSAGGYRGYYEPHAFKCIDMASPGSADSRLPKLPFTKTRRPLWPFDLDIEDPWY
ncbi:MAG: M81 family metallopeptidase [Actinobacteria bacterium]|nr:M81 family metallopeptidase [Actinomycetota bacterium]